MRITAKNLHLFSHLPIMYRYAEPIILYPGTLYCLRFFLQNSVYLSGTEEIDLIYETESGKGKKKNSGWFFTEYLIHY